MRQLCTPKRRNPHAKALQSELFKKRVVPSRKRVTRRERNKLRQFFQQNNCRFY